MILLVKDKKDNKIKKIKRFEEPDKIKEENRKDRGLMQYFMIGGI